MVTEVKPDALSGRLVSCGKYARLGKANIRLDTDGWVAHLNRV